MTGLGIMMIAIVALAVGYFGYARWLEKTWGIDPSRPPPLRKTTAKTFLRLHAGRCLLTNSRQLRVPVP